MIGKLEELVLLGAMRAGERALASDIFERVHEGSKATAFAAVYTTLGRLAKKGLLDEQLGEDRSGRERRVFTINGAGRGAVSDALNASVRVGGIEIAGGRYAF